MTIVRGLGMRIRILSLPQGKDPDEYINAAGPEKFRDAVNDAPNVLDYMLNRALSLYDATTLKGNRPLRPWFSPSSQPSTTGSS